MTFKGAFHSFQTVLILFTDTSGRRWVRASPTLPAAPAPSPQCCGVQELAAQVLPPTGTPLPVLIVSISSQPSLDLPVLLGCPFQGLFLWPWTASLGFVCSESSTCYPHLFFYLEIPGRGEAEGWWQGRSQQCWEHPALAQGGDSQCLQLLSVPSGPTLALGTCGATCALGMLWLPCLLQVLLLAGRGHSQLWEPFSG